MAASRSAVLVAVRRRARELFDFLKSGCQVAAAIEAARSDQSYRIPRRAEIRRSRDRSQCVQVRKVLGTCLIIPGKQLESDQVTDRCDRKAQPGHDLGHLGGLHRLWLDPRAGEQQIHDNIAPANRGTKPHSCQPPGFLLLDRCQQPVPVGQQQPHQSLAVRVIIDHDSNVDVTGKPGICPC